MKDDPARHHDPILPGSHATFPALAAVVAIFVISGALAGQVPGSCSVSARAGIAIPSDVSQLTIDDRQFGELDAGLAFGAEGACPLGGPWAAAVDVEHTDHGAAFYWRFTAALGARAGLGEDTHVSLRGRAGWQIGESQPVPVVPQGDRDGDLVTVSLGDDGPVVGADARLSRALGGSLALFAEAGWRVSWFDRGVVESGTSVQRRSTGTVHVFPITGGLTVRF